MGTILVPNGLRHKATGDKDAKPNTARLHRVNRIVQEHRLRRLTIRLEELAGEIERFIVKNPGIPVDGLLLGQLSKVVEKITVFNKSDGRMTVSELYKKACNGARTGLWPADQAHQHGSD